MAEVFKPMLAVQVDDLESLRYPVLVSPKLDGIRCLVRDGKAVTRNLKPIPNAYACTWLEAHSEAFEGFDGELGLRDPVAPFCEVSSAITSRGGTPDFMYRVFDDVNDSVRGASFASRIACVYDRIKRLAKPLRNHVTYVQHFTVLDVAALGTFEAEFLQVGYEGLMVRDPFGPYKHGRSTIGEGWLLKVKRFSDAEARVIGVTEQEANLNEATRDKLGRTKRSTHQAGKVGKGTLGALQVEDLKTKVRFSIGTGFDDTLRAQLWKRRSDLIGLLVTYKSQPNGAKNAPRFPVFLHFRDQADF